MNKIKVFLITVLICAMCMLVGCESAKYRYDKPCWWDDNTPTMELTNHNSDKVYICKSCAETCHYCGGKATKIGYNYFGGPLALCKECYDNN